MSVTADPITAEDEMWPVLGTITGVSDDGKKLTLNRTSNLFHPNMYIVPEAYDQEANYDDSTRFEVETVDKNHVRLKESAPASIVGSSFFTVPRTTPDEPSQFHRMDCINLLHGLSRYLRSESFVEAPREKRIQDLCLTTPDDGSPEAMLIAHQKLQEHMGIIQEKCKLFGLYEGTGFLATTCTDMLRNILTIQNRLLEAEYMERSLRRTVETGISVDENHLSLLGFNISSTDEDGKKSDYTELLEYFLNAAYMANLRYKDQIVYQRIMTSVDKWVPPEDNPDCEHCSKPACFSVDVIMGRARCEDHRQPGDVDCRVYEEDGMMRIYEEERTSTVEPTQAWVPMLENGYVVDIKTWLHRKVDQHCQVNLFNKFISYYLKGVAVCVGYMSAADSPLFRKYNPDPKKFSFQNGVYDTRLNKFYSYGSSSVPDCCCINHVYEYFDPKWTDMDISDIHVPGYDAIVDSQGYDADMRLWLDVFLGRLFFNVGEYDGWEKFLVIKGFAATGKSTIARAIVKLFGASNVGNIPANCEEQWALASVVNTKVWLCTELKKDWKFPMAVLQSMISGEVVPVHKKNETARDVTWTIQGAAFGNEEPASWQQDAQNAIHRRVMPFPFDIAPRTQDPTVQRKFMRNTARFLVRLVRTYLHQALVVVKDHSVDSILPVRLKDSRAEFLRRTQPLIRFFEDTKDICMASMELRLLINCHELRPANADEAAAAASSVASTTPQHIAGLRLEWRMKMSEVVSRFKEWWIDSNLGPKPPMINSKSVYGTATNHLRLSVERDDDERQDYMYGVKAVTTMRPGAYTGVTFGYGPE